MTKNPVSWETLWSNTSRVNEQGGYDLAVAAIHFIEQEYGAQSMPKLLKALGTAQSFAEVIENGLGVPFTEFDQKWQAWIKQNLEGPR